MGNYNNSSMGCMQRNMNRSYSGRNAANTECSCSDGYSEICKDDYPIGMTYVPWQQWRNIYEPDKALQRGTIFEELDKPFLGMRGGRR